MCPGWFWPAFLLPKGRKRCALCRQIPEQPAFGRLKEWRENCLDGVMIVRNRGAKPIAETARRASILRVRAYCSSFHRSPVNVPGLLRELFVSGKSSQEAQRCICVANHP